MVNYAIGVRFVGLDIGRRRIGLAVSDPSGTLATPWRTVSGSGSVPEVAGRLAALLAELGAEMGAELSDDNEPISGIVVGLPSHLDGRPHEQAIRVRALAAALEQRTGLSITLQDERLTSVEAEQRLALRERDWRKRKARLDAAAAAIILQEYLDQHEVSRQKAEGRS
jgi:putative Holliday junction resolvase